jgi:hypothetical protein
MIYGKLMHMPEWIFSPKMAVGGFNVRTLFDGAFPFTDSHLLQAQVMLFE